MLRLLRIRPRRHLGPALTHGRSGRDYGGLEEIKKQRPPFKETSDADRLKIIKAEIADEKKQYIEMADEIMDVISRYCNSITEADYMILLKVILTGLTAAHSRGAAVSSRRASAIFKDVTK